MRGSLDRRVAVAAAALILVVSAGFAQSNRSATPPKPGLAAVTPAEFGSPFPAATFKNLNAASGQSPSVDLDAIVGKKAIVFVYWMANNARSEQVLRETEEAVDKLGPNKDKVALLAVAAPQYGSTDVEPIKARVAALKLGVPCLYDEGFRLLQEMGVQSVPFIAIVDRAGIYRLSNGGSLKQTLEYKMDVEAAIRRVASTGQLGTYGPLAMYQPAIELIGSKYVDFTAPSVSDGGSKKFSSIFAPNKVNVLVFWSVDCPHCKAAMPRLNDWLKTHPEGINVVTAARVTDDAAKARTAEYCKLNGFVFPTLVDKDMQVGALYQVISTPTLVVIRPDGVIDSVLFSAETDLGQALTVKEQQILKTPAAKS
jgi:thiol-disulfide isomerase/thioredoxin